MALIVKKFGGSSVADAVCIRRVAGIIAEDYLAGNDLVVALSAQGDTTDELIEKAAELNPNASKREMDMLLSTGEQQSVALMAMTLEGMGLPVVSFAGWQVGIQTTSEYGNAKITNLTGERLQEELDKKRIVLIAGFQGINKVGDVTTLGRGASDTTAVALAAALHADICQIYTDVEGVYTADPRKVPTARKLEEITYDEMMELASLGAQVLHNRSVELARRYNVNLEVLSSFVRKPGTKVKEVTKNVEQMKISGIAKDCDVARVAVTGLRDEPGIAFRMFQLMAKEKINVDIILQSIGREKTKDISFTTKKEDAKAAEAALIAVRDVLGYESLSIDTRIAKVSVVGASMLSNSGVAASMFEALSNAKINIKMISTSEIKISVLIDEAEADRAIAAVHKKFFE